MKINLSRKRLLTALASESCFKLIVGLLVVQALWIALSGRYPMAFDEDFHLGVIHLYAQHLSPFWSAHPSGADALGAVARDPSYLYHWLMSFPYRFITGVSGNFATQVVWLRMINIGLFASGLWLYRTLLLRTGASRAVVHFCLLLFVLVPIVPLLAAQINYDNLILPLTALTLLMTLRFSDRLTKKRIDVGLLWQLLIVCLLTSLVKYAFLPVFMAILLFLAVRLYKGYHGTGAFKTALLSSLQALGRPLTIGLVLATVLAGGLFVERYGVNLLRYHQPVVDCGEVLNYEHCRNYGPWIRDYNFAHHKAPTPTNPVAYTQHWLYGMWFRSFFAVDGPATGFETRGPLTLPGVSTIIFGLLTAVSLIWTAKRLWRRYNRLVLWLFSFTIVLHILVLWQDQYKMFLRTGQPVAINGRYLLPILPLILVIAALALKMVTANRPRLQAGLAMAVLVCFLWGGGALTYILRSNDSWYWQGSIMAHPNHAVQRLLGPVTPGYHQPIQYLH